MAFLTQFWSILAGRRWLLAMSVLFGLLFAGANLVPPLLIRQLIAWITEGGGTPDELMLPGKTSTSTRPAVSVLIAVHISTSRLCSGLSGGWLWCWRIGKSAARARREISVKPPTVARREANCRRVTLESVIIEPFTS